VVAGRDGSHARFGSEVKKGNMGISLPFFMFHVLRARGLMPLPHSIDYGALNDSDSG
jgi:hypothetical protein